jgi:hypothetical protein
MQDSVSFSLSSDEHFFNVFYSHLASVSISMSQFKHFSFVQPYQRELKYQHCLFIVIVFIFIQFFCNTKCCPTYSYVTSIRVLQRNFKNSTLVSVTRTNLPPARFISAAIVVCSYRHLRKRMNALKQVLC